MMPEETWEAVLLVAVGVIHGLSERVLAFEWLRADARARRAPFTPWAALALLLPILGVGLYLLARPRGTVPPWRLPDAAVPALAAAAAAALAGLTLGLPEYRLAFALPLPILLSALGLVCTLALGLCAGWVVRTRRSAWLDNPLPLLAGLLLALATLSRLGGAFSAGAGMLLLAALPLALAAALIVAAAVHLAAYRPGPVLAGMAAGGLAVALVRAVLLPWGGYGLGGFLAAGLCLALATAVVAVLSVRGRLASPPPEPVSFLAVAAPLWALAWLSLLAAAAGAWAAWAWA